MVASLLVQPLTFGESISAFAQGSLSPRRRHTHTHTHTQHRHKMYVFGARKRRPAQGCSSILLITAILGIVFFVSSVCVLVNQEVLSSVWNKLGISAISTVNAQTYCSDQTTKDSPPAACDDLTCLSRSQQYLYRNPAHIKPIPDPLLKAWAAYAQMHRYCSHHNWSALFLSRDRSPTDHNDGCQYLIYIEGSEGLGNVLLSLTSAFTFAMATGRMLLLDSRANIAKLLCEPFPESSWVLPPNFPYRELLDCPSLGPFRHNNTNASCVSLNLQHNIHHKDQQLFCEDVYTSLQDVKWVAWTSNQYFLTNLLLIPSFWQRMHPVFRGNVGQIFTFLARLLLLPANDTWAIILREFWSYLSGANAQLGVQVRLYGRVEFDLEANDRIMECLLQNNLLPRFSEKENLTELSILHNRKMEARENHADIVVMLASLQGKYAQIMKDQFAKLPTKGTKMVRVHSVSQLGSQKKGFEQAQLAFVEMWLLSYSDNLATSKKSTFGYIAQGLGAIHPYILDLNKGEHASPCVLGQSVEPCTHYPKIPRCLGADANLSIDHKQWIRTHFSLCQDHVGGWQLVPSGAAQGNPVSFDFL
ncbi:hypothetical protein GOP47_0023158 [Adiantum capillus-veneris]|uniref:Fucosyltransferase n=1 Tax=Adiantum capillus-veneris TaxID=13818 RepID=A0A9D4Z606_ADICA|nr:hypothetical protein GOP47_0023158 [Adiantum capillus-veneris]